MNISAPYRPLRAGWPVAILDSARDAAAVAIARNLSPRHQSLFDGTKGADMALAAPHLFECDPAGNVAKLMLVLSGPGECGILAEVGPLPPPSERLSPDTDDFTLIRRHFRRFLIVRRELDGDRAFFRFYDPRVLRAFLPACTPDELRTFFGPVVRFHAQDDDRAFVRSFHLDPANRLVVERKPVSGFLEQFRFATKARPSRL